MSIKKPKKRNNDSGGPEGKIKCSGDNEDPTDSVEQTCAYNIISSIQAWVSEKPVQHSIINPEDTTSNIMRRDLSDDFWAFVCFHRSDFVFCSLWDAPYIGIRYNGNESSASVNF